MGKRRSRIGDPTSEFHERAKWSTFTSTILFPPVPRTRGFKRFLIGCIVVGTAFCWIMLIVLIIQRLVS